MKIIFCGLVTVVLLTFVGLLLNYFQVTPLEHTGQQLYGDQPFEVFEHEAVSIFVPRFDDASPRFSDQIIEGRLFVVNRPGSQLQLENVNTGCGCSVVHRISSETPADLDHPVELEFSINTLGRIGPQDFPLLFSFRDRQGELRQYQARLKLLLERELDVPSVMDAVVINDHNEDFIRTIEVSSKVPNIQWDRVNVVALGGTANVSLRPVRQSPGISFAELTVSGRLSDVSSDGLTLFVQSSQFTTQPTIILPFLQNGEQIKWKPEVLQFHDSKALTKLVLQANFDCSADELSLDIDSDQLTYRIKKVGRLFVVDFQLGDGEVPADNAGLSGMIRLIRNGEIAAEIPYVWSGT
jgi:hypothetical protein